MPVFTPIAHDAFVADVSTLATAIAADPWRPSYLIGVEDADDLIADFEQALAAV